MIPKIYSQSRTNYGVYILIIQNNESGEPEWNDIGKKYQDKNELILYNTIIYAKENQISDMSRGLAPSSRIVRKWHMEELQHSTFIENKNINLPIQKGSIWYEWFAAE